MAILPMSDGTTRNVSARIISPEDEFMTIQQWMQARDAEIVEMRKHGIPVRNIAKEFSLSVNAIYAILARNA